MKKILALILSFALACSLASCGEQEESSAAEESVSEMVSSETSNEDVPVEEPSIEDHQSEADSNLEDVWDNLYYTIDVVDASVHGNRILHDIKVYNESDSYIDGIFEFVFTDEETGQIYKCGIPLTGISSSSYEFGTFWLPIGIYDENNPNVSINVIRLEASDSLDTSQEITAENVSQYIYTNYDIGGIYNNQYTITADVENCSYQYFSGTVTVNVYGSDGELVVSETETITNLGPGSTEPMVLMADLSENYTFETIIENFEFSKNPKI